MRITLDIDDPVLQDLKRLQAREGQSLGRLASDLLAQALSARQRREAASPRSQWYSRAMGARVDLSDREAVWDAKGRR